jgi:hypothetical protein
MRTIKSWIGGICLVIILGSYFIWLYIIKPIGLKIGNYSKKALNTFLAPFRNANKLRKQNKALRTTIWIEETAQSRANI